MKPLKTRDLRPCDSCGGSIAPFFYRLTMSFRQLVIDRTAVNAVLGTAQIFGGDLRMGEVMSPNSDATVEMPGYQVDKDLLICQECIFKVTLRPLDLMLESENEEPNQ